MKEVFVRRNLVGFVIKVIGLIMIGWGFIQGLIVSVQVSQHNMVGMDEWGMANQFDGSGLWSFLSVVFSTTIYGILVIGFGEVIDLLQKINDQNEPRAVTSVMPELKPVPVNSIPLSAEQQLKEFYSKMNVKIESIAPTKHRDVFVVTLDDREEYIELRGHSTQLLSEEEAGKYLR
ncbi:hypothetical protein [Sporosarcina beigongshangi]|uniref:hypothetical protein n=1 Tax=Sporosarcina beigongshangi TaxID=2782538 RepID=UPI00193A4C47|nr:hypothetical protein [Sporosarcina beigongshangi]